MSTFLTIFNNVMTRLREDTVTEFDTSDTYENVVRLAINDAKRQVEQAHNWSFLRTKTEITTSDGTATYTIDTNGLDEPITMYDTLGNELGRYDSTYKIIRSGVSDGSGRPTHYSFDVPSSTDTVVKFYPTPDDTYTITYYHMQYQADLSATTDTLSVPSRPVELLAHALLVRERGENQGTSTVEFMAIYETALSDAIARDASKFPEEWEWKVV